MSFTFDFDVADSEQDLNSVSESNKECEINVQKEIGEDVREDEEINIDWQDMWSRVPSIRTDTVAITESQALRVVSSEHVEQTISPDTANCTSDVQLALQANSDLLPHVYEGGLKIWECSVDLTQYLASEPLTFSGAAVLELGCGAALPGIYTYTQGAKVTLQDYNAEVLRLITAPNVCLNSKENSGSTCRCKLLAGDWTKVQSRLMKDKQKFDFILTSETIYSRDSYQKLHNILESLLKPGGSIYLAAKTYYFGVGGGTRDFEDLLDANDVFDHVVLKEYTDGVQREILKLTFKDKKDTGS